MTGIPNPDRDPYFNRTPGADQVPPVVVPSDLTRVSGGNDELEIVRDYRMRREMIGFERSLQLAGRFGSWIYQVLVVIFVVYAEQTLRSEHVYDGHPDMRLLLRSPWLFRLLIELTMLLSLVAISRTLVLKKRRGVWLLTLLILPPAIAAIAMEPVDRFAVVILPSSLLLLLTLWRPAGRLYFSDRYRELIERTPAMTFQKGVGRRMALLLLSALFVVQFTNRYLLFRLLESE